MYRVAICDQKCKDRDFVQKIIEQKIVETGMDCILDVFDSTTSLLKSPYFKEYMLIILEADMPEIMGTEAGKRIRAMNQRVQIAYMSETTKYAYDAFKVKAFEYLLKPIKHKVIEEFIEYATQIVVYFELDKVCVKSKEGIISVYIGDVIAVESKSRKAIFILKDGSEIVSVSNRSTFEKGIMPIPLQNNFLQPHKSYFINMDYVSSFCTDGITMVNGLKVPVSREKMLESKKKYLKYTTKGLES